MVLQPKLDILLIAVYIIDISSTTDDKFYAIAHMSNDPGTVEWAMSSGANALEMDLQFDGISGRPTRFHHESQCDVSSSVEEQLTFMLQFPTLALIYIDSKTEKLPCSLQQRAGTELVKTLETLLFVKGYKGKVLVGSGSGREFLMSAAKGVENSSYASMFYFALDGDTSDAVPKLEFLSQLPVSTLIYSTEITVCFSITFYEEIRLAGINHDRGVISNVFIGTLDRSSSFDKYFTCGARGILTNEVPNLVTWTKSKGLTLASPGDDSLPKATSTNVLKDAGSCDCDYIHKRFESGGCKIVQESPAKSACHCRYKGGWICDGVVIRCGDPASRYCETPDRSRDSCEFGGGDCYGY